MPALTISIVCFGFWKIPLKRGHVPFVNTGKLQPFNHHIQPCINSTWHIFGFISVVAHCATEGACFMGYPMCIAGNCMDSVTNSLPSQDWRGYHYYYYYYYTEGGELLSFITLRGSWASGNHSIRAWVMSVLQGSLTSLIPRPNSLMVEVIVGHERGRKKVCTSLFGMAK